MTGKILKWEREKKKRIQRIVGGLNICLLFMYFFFHTLLLENCKIDSFVETEL
jgi:hypothetical protein